MVSLDEDDTSAIARSELAILTRTLEGLQGRLKAIDHLANSYASMATVRKPSWVGIILISLAIAVELLPMKILMSMSAGFTHLMFICGMLSLGAGAILEALVAIVRERQIRAEKADLLNAISQTTEKTDSLFKRVFG